MITSIYYSLPYELRRFLYAKIKSKSFRLLQTQRSIVTDSDYSLKPYVQNKCIFIHIPKSAGVSICRTLFNNLAGGHQDIKLYQIVFSKKEFDSYFKFTFVRNPWDRLFSAYNFLKKGGMNDSDRVWASENLSEYVSFDDFVKKWLTIANTNKHMHFAPQYKMLCLPSSDNIDVDFLGFYENIQDDFIYIKNQLSLSADLELKYENKTESNDRQFDYRNFYTDEARDIVSQVYKKDIDLLGYNYDNSSLKKQLAHRPI